MLGMQATAPDSVAHTWLDDLHALLAGSLFVALGLIMFAHAGLLTGGVAGAAFLASYASGLSLALFFFLFSLPLPVADFESLVAQQSPMRNKSV